MTTTRYATRTEAIDRLIVHPIEATGVVEDARAEYDVDAIATLIIDRDPHAGTYGQNCTAAEFWDAVEGADRIVRVVAARLGITTKPGQTLAEAVIDLDPTMGEVYPDLNDFTILDEMDCGTLEILWDEEQQTAGYEPPRVAAASTHRR